MKRLALAVFLVLVSACTTYPPPKIENGCYYNYEYGFVLVLPDSDWELMEGTHRHLRKVFPFNMYIRDWPREFSMEIRRELRRSILLDLYNRETSGRIVLLATKTLYPPTEIKSKSRFLETMWPIVAKMDPKVTAAGSCGIYPYRKGHDACVYVDYNSEDGVSNMTAFLFTRFFPVGNNVHRIDVFFIFNQGTYSVNYPVFVELVGSLQPAKQDTTN